MKKNLAEVVFILDRSGSMGGLEADTIGGFNAMLERQKTAEGEANITTVLFDDKYEILHDRININAVAPITDSEYFVRGSTALLDAVGRTVHNIGNAQRYTAEEYRAEKVIFVITTDGMENASREYSYTRVKTMIERQKQKYGWEFIFLGANIDAVETAGRIGIHASRAQNYHADKAGVELNFKVTGDVIRSYRAAPCCPIPDNWKDEIDNDYKKRAARKVASR